MDSRLPRVSFCFNCEERHLNLCLVCQSNEKILYLPVGRGFTPADVVTVIKYTSVCDKTKNLYLFRRGDHRSSICSGFAQKPLKRVILSEQRVASRTFGFVSGNIANKSKSENCQDNFRDLRGFILSFWLKSNILCRVGLHIIFL